MKIVELVKNLNPSKFHLALFIGFVAVCLLLSYMYKQHSQIVQGNELIKSLTDTVTVYKTKDGKNAAYIRVIRASNRKEILEITKIKDKEIYKILAAEKKIETITKFVTVTKIDTTVKIDTIKIDSAGRVKIKKTVNNPWYTAGVTVEDHTLKLDLQVKNKFIITHKNKSQGFLQPDAYVVDVKNENPYTTTDSLSSYVIKPPKKTFLQRVGSSAVLVGVAGALGALLFHK